MGVFQANTLQVILRKLFEVAEETEKISFELEMITHGKMHSLQSVLQTKVRVWAATSLVALILVGSTYSNPVEAPPSIDQASDSDIPAGYAPAGNFLISFVRLYLVIFFF